MQARGEKGRVLEASHNLALFSHVLELHYARLTPESEVTGSRREGDRGYGLCRAGLNNETEVEKKGGGFNRGKNLTVGVLEA